MCSLSLSDWSQLARNCRAKVCALQGFLILITVPSLSPSGSVLPDES